MKTCNKCEEIKSLEDFGKNKYGKDGLRSVCKECSRKSCRDYHGRNKEKVSQWRKNWDKNNPNGRRNLSLRNKYGINTAIYDEMLKNQKDCCAICDKNQSELYKRMAVDHCHVTGKIRGLLCDDCNRALGLLKDKVQSLEKAIKYLEKQEEIC